MARDLEEFLRRAAQRRNQQQPPKAHPDPVIDLEVAPEPRRSAPPQGFSGQSSFGSGQSDLPRQLTRESDPHGLPSVDMADERMDEHLHDLFDHGLGDLAAPTKSLTASDASGETAPAADVVRELVEMLGTQSGIQKAVLLKEILDRPIDRWD